MFSLADRVALVTGSSRGIGRALAEGLAGAGARIAVNGRDPATLLGVVTDLQDKGADAFAAPFDVTEPGGVERGIEAIESEFGPIDILVSNAGMQHRAPLEDFPLADWQRLMRTNLDSLFIVGQAVARRMIPRKRGSIINICSILSGLARNTVAPYSASKAAAANLTRGMATEWAKHGIRANGLAPGYIATELNTALMADAAFNDWLKKRVPAGRWGDVDELVGAAVFLASDAASFVNGHILYVDGGASATL
jgi:gluconate 5-dehydrogenase